MLSSLGGGILAASDRTIHIYGSVLVRAAGQQL